MPIFSSSKLPPPKSEDEFEDMVTDILMEYWKDPGAIRYGRSGQKQDGIDILGKSKVFNGRKVAAQCKNKSNITIGEIRDIIDEVRCGFHQKIEALSELVIAISCPRDTKIQKEIIQQQKKNDFSIVVFFWEDVIQRIAFDEKLISKYYPTWQPSIEPEPALDVEWVLEDDSFNKEITTESNPEFFDLLFRLQSYSEKEILFLDKEQQVEARKYNDEVNEACENKYLVEEWLNFNAIERYKSGVKCGIKISAINAPAKDILLTMNFPDDIEIFEFGQEPARVKSPKLPIFPDFSSPFSNYLSIFGDLNERFGAGFMGSMMDSNFHFSNLTVRLSKNNFGGCRIDGQVVSLHMEKLVHGRYVEYTVAKNAGFVLSPKTKKCGNYVVKWSISAENIKTPIEGELKIIVSGTSGIAFNNLRTLPIGLTVSKII